MSQSVIKPANESLSMKAAQPKMEELCFQLTAGANYSNFALGDAIHCRHWDHSGSLKVRNPLTNRTVYVRQFLAVVESGVFWAYGT